MRSSKRALVSLAVLLSLQNCASAQTATGRIGTGLPTGTAIGSGGTLPGPGPITDYLPASDAINVSLTPTIAFASTGATSFFIKFGTVNPPTDQISLGGTAAYSPNTPLLNSTTYYWQPLAVNAVASTAGSIHTFTTLALPGGAPSNITSVFPVNGATSTTIVPTLAWTADDTDTYVIRFGTTNPPVTETSLADATTYSTGTLAYNTTYYWRILATNSFGTTTGSVWSFTTRTDPGPSTFCTRPCQRLFLTTARKSELSAKRVANTQQWQDVKALADAVPTQDLTDVTTLSGALGTGGVGTTFTVADGSIFPSGTPFQVRIDVELLTVTRSGNTLTVVSRGDITYVDTLGAQSHTSGAEVWEYVQVSWDRCATHAPAVAIMEHAGATGYETRARACFGELLAAYAPISTRHSGNYDRDAWINIPIVYDWIHEHLSAHEISVFGPIIEDAANWHLQNPKFCVGGSCPTRQGVWEASSIANVQGGQTRAVLIMAAATAGDTTSAQDQWNTAYGYYNDYMIPAMASGAFYSGNSPEGAEYGFEGFYECAQILELIKSAIGEDTWGRVPGWDLRTSKFYAYALQPGGRGHHDGAFTTGTMSLGGTSLVVADASTFAIGDAIAVHLDGFGGRDCQACYITIDNSITTDVLPAGHAPVAGDVGGQVYVYPYGEILDGVHQGLYTITAIVNGKWRLDQSAGPAGAATSYWDILKDNYFTVVVGKSGNTLTVSNPATFHTDNGAVHHQVTMWSWGDIETWNNWDDLELAGNAVAVPSGLMILFDRLKTTDPTWAGYVKYILDHSLPLNFYATVWHELMWYDTTVTGVDYTAASLPAGFSTAGSSAAASGSTGLVIGLSNWTNTASVATFFVGSESGGRGFDHATHEFNSYTYKRKGVCLTCNLRGYGVTGLHFPPPWTSVGDAGCVVGGNVCFGLGASAFIGWRYHNTVSMNGHGTSAIVTESLGPSVLSRSDLQTAYDYARGNAGDVYRFTGFGFVDNARIFQRDFLYVKPDLLMIADYLTYGTASTSPTGWYLQFAGDPSLASQRITSTYAGQKLVQDVVLPSGATFTKTTHSTEDLFLKGYRYEVRSGANTATEYFCSVLQGMDSGDTPLAVTTLTTTNACVVEVAAGASQCPNGCVIAMVKGATPTLPIVWTHSAAAPDSYAFGLPLSTAYHITRVAKTVTIVAATGSGDTTSSASGKLAVP